MGVCCAMPAGTRRAFTVLLVACCLISSVKCVSRNSVSMQLLSPQMGSAAAAPFLLRLRIGVLEAGLHEHALVEVLAYRETDRCGEGEETMLLEYATKATIAENSELFVWTGQGLLHDTYMICVYLSDTDGTLLSSAFSRVVIASSNESKPQPAPTMTASEPDDFGVLATLEEQSRKGTSCGKTEISKVWTWEERLQDAIDKDDGEVRIFSELDLLGGRGGVHVAHIRCRSCYGADAQDLIAFFLRENRNHHALVKLFSPPVLQRASTLPPPISTQRSDSAWDGCFAALSTKTVAEQLQSDATILALGNLLAPQDAAQGTSARPPRLRIAKWITDDVSRFMQSRMSAGPSLCVALMVSHVDQGANAARRGPSNDAKLRRRAYGSEGSVIVDSVRRLEQRLNATFRDVYLATDYAAPDEAALVAAALHVIPYQGVLSAGRLGDPSVDGHVRDVLAARDLQVCSETDWFLSNDSAELLDCGYWSSQVRARRKVNSRRKVNNRKSGRHQGEGSSSVDYHGRRMEEGLYCRQAQSVEMLEPDEQCAARNTSGNPLSCESGNPLSGAAGTPLSAEIGIEEWLKSGRRPGEFAGNLLQVDTAACRQPSLFGGGGCDDGGKVLCVTPQLKGQRGPVRGGERREEDEDGGAQSSDEKEEEEEEAVKESGENQGNGEETGQEETEGETVVSGGEGCIVYSFGVGFDHGFESSLLARTTCRVFSFDPTPEVVHFMSTLPPHPRWAFRPWGIAAGGGQGTLEVREATSMSRPATSVDGQMEEHSVQFFTLQEVMLQLGHRKVTVVKLDVEGMEFEVLSQFQVATAGPEQLVVEMHATVPNEKSSNAHRAWRWVQAHRQLGSMGFRLFHANEQAYFCPGLSYHGCPDPESDGVLMEMSYMRRGEGGAACVPTETLGSSAEEREAIEEERDEEEGAAATAEEEEEEEEEEEGGGMGGGQRGGADGLNRDVSRLGREADFILPLLESASGEFGQRLAGLEAALQIGEVLGRHVLLPPSSTLHLLLDRDNVGSHAQACGNSE